MSTTTLRSTTGDEEVEDTESSFKDEAESAAVTINEWVELDEDEEDDDEFNPDEAAEEEGEEDEDEDEDDEEEDEEEIDEDEEKALQEEEALAEQEADAELQASAGGGAAQEEEDDGEEDGEGEEEDGDEEEEDGEEDESILESGAGMMSGEAMSAFVHGVMKADGPTVATVLLRADGSKEQLVSGRHHTTFIRTRSRPQRTATPLLMFVCCGACFALQSLDMTPRVDSRQLDHAATEHHRCVDRRSPTRLLTAPCCVCYRVSSVQLVVCLAARRVSSANTLPSTSSFTHDATAKLTNSYHATSTLSASIVNSAHHTHTPPLHCIHSRSALIRPVVPAVLCCAVFSCLHRSMVTRCVVISCWCGWTSGVSHSRSRWRNGSSLWSRVATWRLTARRVERSEQSEMETRRRKRKRVASSPVRAALVQHARNSGKHDFDCCCCVFCWYNEQLCASTHIILRIQRTLL